LIKVRAGLGMTRQSCSRFASGVPAESEFAKMLGRLSRVLQKGSEARRKSAECAYEVRTHAISTASGNEIRTCRVTYMKWHIVFWSAVDTLIADSVAM
jgi:hypothetical protein